jgi:hypothetical protein
MAEIRKALTAAVLAGLAAAGTILTAGPVTSSDIPGDVAKVIGAAIIAGLGVYFIPNKPAGPPTPTAVAK